eukprot:s818_g11.t1
MATALRSLRSQWLVLLLRSVLGSPHEEFQMQTKIHRTHQDYGVGKLKPSHARRLQQQTCEDVHAALSWEPMRTGPRELLRDDFAMTKRVVRDDFAGLHEDTLMNLSRLQRIGYELIDVESVATATVDLVQDTLMARAVAFWSSALQVRRAQGPLKMDPAGIGCFKYDARAWLHNRREAALVQRPVCQVTRAPAIVYRVIPVHVTWICGKATAQDTAALCLLEPIVQVVVRWRPPSKSALELPVPLCAKQVAPRHQKVKECQHSDALLAFAISCAVDQCDRPIFGTINFCPSKLVTDDINMLVSTAIHELAHVLVFSNTHFQNFRYSNGSPIIPRLAQDETRFQDEVIYTCSSSGYQWNVATGNLRYVDISPTIVNSFSERGYDCQCPIGKTDIAAGCFYPSPPFLQVPSCVVRMTTPTVLAEVRNFFDCPTLEGAELENQEGNGCSIIGSHWEQRVFAGEIMSPVSTERLVNTYVSRVSLAVFQDSGWYRANMSAADPLVKGVHWGYKQGCNFATAKCVDNDVPISKVFCSAENQVSCSLDRKAVVTCDACRHRQSEPTCSDGDA